jgi:hypothetical protein
LIGEEDLSPNRPGEIKAGSTFLGASFHPQAFIVKVGFKIFENTSDDTYDGLRYFFHNKIKIS